jgi:hypothetical protein
MIIFDMDETLVHCVNDPYTDNPDIILTIYFPEEPEPVEVHHLSLIIMFCIGWI